METEGQVHRLHIHDVTVIDAGIYKAVLGEAQSIMALRIKGDCRGCGQWILFQILLTVIPSNIAFTPSLPH